VDVLQSGKRLLEHVSGDRAAAGAAAAAATDTGAAAGTDSHDLVVSASRTTAVTPAPDTGPAVAPIQQRQEQQQQQQQEEQQQPEPAPAVPPTVSSSVTLEGLAASLQRMAEQLDAISHTVRASSTPAPINSSTIDYLERAVR